MIGRAIPVVGRLSRIGWLIRLGIWKQLLIGAIDPLTGVPQSDIPDERAREMRRARLSDRRPQPFKVGSRVQRSMNGDPDALSVYRRHRQVGVCGIGRKHLGHIGPHLTVGRLIVDGPLHLLIDGCRKRHGKCDEHSEQRHEPPPPDRGAASGCQVACEEP